MFEAGARLSPQVIVPILKEVLPELLTITDAAGRIRKPEFSRWMRASGRIIGGGSAAAATRVTLTLTPAIPRPVTAPRKSRVELFGMIASIHGGPFNRSGPGNVKQVTH